MNAYYKIQKSIPLKKKMARWKAIRKHGRNNLFINEHFLSKIFRLFKIHKNMIFLLKKRKILSLKKRDKASRYYYRYLAMVKFLKVVNTKMKIYLNKHIVLDRRFETRKFVKKKNKTKLLFKKTNLKNLKKKMVISRVKKKKKDLISINTYLKHPYIND